MTCKRLWGIIIKEQMFISEVHMAGKQKEIKAITNKDDRDKALNAALAQIQKEFGIYIDRFHES